MYMKKINVKKVYYLFWIFVFGSIFGWFFEGIYTYIRKGVIINHSAVAIGPFNMAYGLAACVLSASLVILNCFLLALQVGAYWNMS